MSDLPVNNKHLAELRASGLTDETIRAAGIRSITGAEATEFLGWQSKNYRHPDGILFPRIDCDGHINGSGQYKPDFPRENPKGKGVIKYETPPKTPVSGNFGPRFKENLGSGKPLVLTEGAKKCYAVDQLGYPAIALPGVWGFGKKRLRDETGKAYGKRQLIPDFQKIDWSGRKVVIAFDSDAVTKHEVQYAEGEVGRLLTDAGANVRVLRLPDVGEGKTGLDDFLVYHGDAGPAELEKLIDAAEEAETPGPQGCFDVAVELLENEFTIDGHPAIVWYQDQLYIFTGASYRPVEKGEIIPAIQKWCAEHGKKQTPRHAAEVYESLKALCLQPYARQSPFWVKGKRDLPNAADVLVGRNSAIDLSTLDSPKPVTLDPTPNLFTTTSLGYDIDLKAAEPTRWLQFMEEVWGDDIESIETLHEFMGYCLTADTSIQKSLMIVGATRGGKGVIARVKRDLIGPDNVVGPTLAGLSDRFGLQTLIDKRLAIISDARLGSRVDQSVITERLLSITGEDALSIERKNKTAVTRKLGVRFMVLTNELPRFTDSSTALARRFIILRIKNSFAGKEDPTLSDKLRGELPGILRYAIDGLVRLRERGYFRQPEAAKGLTDQMVEISSPVSTFIEDECVIEDDAEVRAPSLYASWCEWCKTNGRVWVGDAATFGRDLRATLPNIDVVRRTEQGRKIRVYRGIRTVTP